MARKKKEEKMVPDSFADLDKDDSPIYNVEESDSSDEVIEKTPTTKKKTKKSVVAKFVVEYDSLGKIILPERDHEWEENVLVVTTDWAERLLNDASSRLRGLYDVVAFQGHHRQNRFLAVLSAQMLRAGTEDGPGGTIFVPRELEDYEPLQEMEKLDDAPDGFVAFRVR